MTRRLIGFRRIIQKSESIDPKLPTKLNTLHATCTYKENLIVPPCSLQTRRT